VTEYKVNWFNRTVVQGGWLDLSAVTCTSNHQSYGKRCENLIDPSLGSYWENDASKKNEIVFDLKESTVLSQIQWKGVCTGLKTAIKTFSIAASEDGAVWTRATNPTPTVGEIGDCNAFKTVVFDDSRGRYWKLRVYNSFLAGQGTVRIRQVRLFGQLPTEKTGTIDKDAAEVVLDTPLAGQIGRKFYVTACNANGCSAAVERETSAPGAPAATMLPLEDTGQVIYDDYNGTGFAQVKTGGWAYRGSVGGAWDHTPARKTLAYGWGNLAGEAGNYRDSCNEKFQYIFRKGAYGYLDDGPPAFNEHVAAGTVLRRECRFCQGKFKLVYYKRLTAVPGAVSLYDELTGTYTGDAGNALNQDFELYFGWADLENGENRLPNATSEDLDPSIRANFAWAVFDAAADPRRQHLEGGGCRQLHGPFDGSVKSAKVRVDFPSPRERYVNVKLRLWAVGSMANPRLGVRTLGEKARSYSSMWDNHAQWGTSTISSSRAWIPHQNQQNDQQWMIIDLEGDDEVVYGLKVGVRKDAGTWYVTKLNVGVSTDKVNWKYAYGLETGLVANGGDTTIFFPSGPLVGRYVLIEPKAMVGNYALRADAITLKKAVHKLRHQYIMDVPEGNREYTSTWSNHAPGVGWARSRISGPGNGWVVHGNNKNDLDQYVIMDTGRQHQLLGVLVAGRKDTPSQYVTQIKVQVSADKSNWVDVDGGHNIPTHSKNDKDLIRKILFNDGPLPGRYVKIYVKGYSGHPSWRMDVVIRTEYINAQENQRTYSSVHANEAIGTGHARSMIDSELAWSAASNDQNQWMIIDAGRKLTVKGVAVQARKDIPSQRVTKIKVQVSNDKATWRNVEGGAELATNCIGDDMDIQRVVFPSGPVVGQYIKIAPVTFEGHISMRADIIESFATESPFQVSLNNKPIFKNVRFDYSCFGVGREVVKNLNDRRRRFSSIFENHMPGEWVNGIGYGQSRLGSRQAWSAGTNDQNQWLIMPVGKKRAIIVGVVLQGRGDYQSQWVKKITVDISNDMETWAAVENGKEFEAATGATTKLYFQNPVRGAYVRINPREWNEHISLRAAVITYEVDETNNPWSTYPNAIYNPWNLQLDIPERAADGICYQDIDTVVKLDDTYAELQLHSDMSYRASSEDNVGLMYGPASVVPRMLDHGWWGFDRVSMREVNASLDHGVPSRVFSTAVKPSRSLEEWGNVTHYKVEHFRTLLAVPMGPSWNLRSGDLLGQTKCPAQFRVAFELSVRNQAGYGTKQASLFSIRQSYRKTDCELVALVSTPDNKLRLRSGTAPGECATEDSAQSLNGFEGDTVHVELTVANGKAVLRLDGNPWIQTRVTAPLVISRACKVWVTDLDPDYAVFSGIMANFRLDEILLPENIFSALPLAQHDGYDSNATEVTAATVTMPYNYAVSFQFTLLEHPAERLRVFSIGVMLALWVSPPSSSQSFTTFVLQTGEANPVVINRAVSLHVVCYVAVEVVQSRLLLRVNGDVWLHHGMEMEAREEEPGQVVKLAAVNGDLAAKVDNFRFDKIEEPGSAEDVSSVVWPVPAQPSSNAQSVFVSAKVPEGATATTRVRVQACNDFGCSAHTESGFAVPSAPVNVSLEAVSTSTHRVLIEDDRSNNKATHYVIHPPTDCVQIMQSIGDDFRAGQYFIQPEGHDRVSVFCDDEGRSQIACDQLPSGRQYGSCMETNERSDSNTCKGFGLDILVPKTKTHLQNMLVRYDYLSYEMYWRAIPGVYSDVVAAMSSGAVMTSDGGSNFKAIGGGRWWLNDQEHSELNGDYQSGCWLGGQLDRDSISMGKSDATTPTYTEIAAVAVHNFEDTNNFHGWNCVGITTCGSWGKICGGYNKLGKNSVLQQTFSGLEPGTYTVEMDVFFIDSWDHNDRLRVYANGVEVWISENYHYNQGPGLVSKCGNNGWKERTRSISLTVSTTSSQLKLEVKSTLSEGLTNEGFAIDNVKVTGSVRRLNRGWVVETIVDHNFEDGDQHGWTCGGNPSACGGFTKLCGGYGKRGKNENIEQTFSVVPGSTYNIDFDVYAIDSWDGEYAYAHINDVEVYKSGKVYKAGTKECGGGWEDQMVTHVSKAVIATGNTLKIKVFAGINQNSNDESLAIDNVKITTYKQQLFGDYNISNLFSFKDHNCEYSTRRYLCSSNTEWATRGAPSVRRVVDTTSGQFTGNAQDFVAVDATTSVYEASVSACNKYGCGPATSVRTTVPDQPISVALKRNCTECDKFSATITYDRNRHGGVPISKFKLTLYSYDDDGMMASSTTEEAAEAADESVQVVLLDPIFTVTAISKVRVHACNGLGCSEASTESSWTSLSINAESEVQSVVERYESNNISFTLASSVAPGDGDPQTTMLYWEAAGNVSQSIAASLLVGKTLSGNVSFGFQTSRAVSLLDLEFIGEVEYKFACQYCSKGVGGVRFCGSLKDLYTTKVTFKPEAPNGGAKVTVSAPVSGGRIRLDFHQTGFWGSDSLIPSRGRTTEVRVFLGNHMVAGKTFVQPPSTATGAPTHGIVRGLMASKSYTFQIAVKNGDEVSDWTQLSDPVSPVVAVPDPPQILIGHESIKVYSTSVHLPILPTFLNGAELVKLRIYVYPLGSCDASSAKWENAQNITYDMNGTVSEDRPSPDFSSSESTVIYVPVFFGLRINERYIFRAEVKNSLGYSSASYCCEEKNVVKTDPVDSVVELPKASSGRRRLSNSSTSRLKQDILDTPYDNTRFQLWPGYYSESEMVFLARSMSLESRGDSSNSADTVTIDCQHKRCFDFQKGFLPKVIKGIVFQHGAAPDGENGGFFGVTPDSKSGKLEQVFRITQCTFIGGSAKNGKGGAVFIYSPKTPIVLTDIRFKGSTAGFGGALYVDSTDVNVTNSVFELNQATVDGGAVAFAGTEKSSIVYLVKVKVEGATAGNNGGAFYSESSKLHVSESSIGDYVANDGVRTQTKAEASGGFMYAKTSSLSLSDVSVMGVVSSIDGTIGCFGSLIEAKKLTMTSNQARSGGALFGLLCTAYVTESAFSQCQVSQDGGAIKLAMDSELFVTNSTFTSNMATTNKGNGGAIHATGALKVNVKSSTFSGNHAGRGGAIAAHSTDITLTDNTFESNEAGQGGGGALFWSQTDPAKYPVVGPSNAFADNLAIYGNNVASDPKSIFIGEKGALEDARISDLNITNKGTFEVFVMLKDLYNQTFSDSAHAFPTFNLVLSSVNNGTMHKLIGEVAKEFPDTANGGKGVLFNGLTLAERAGLYQATVEGSGGLKHSQLALRVAECDLGEVLQSTTSGTVCQPCEPGTYSPSITAATCAKCPANNYQSEPQKTSCLPCPTGLEALQEGSVRCIDKKPGTVRVASLSRRDDSFNQLTFRWEPTGEEHLTGYRYEINSAEDFTGDLLFNGTLTGKSSTEVTVSLADMMYNTQVYFRVRGLLNLAIGEWSTAPQWSTVSDCRDASVYLHAIDADPREWKCEKCLSGTICDGAVWHRELITKKGYSRVAWAPSILAPPLKCPYEYACVGGPVTAEPDALCLNGTTGPLCTVCAEGYGYQFGKCNECSMRNVGQQLGIVGAVVFAIVALILYVRKKLKKYKSLWKDLLRVMKMNIDFMQITSAVPELINVAWPPVFYEFLQFFDFVNADFLSLTGASCVGGLNFISKYFVMSMLPIAGFALGCAVYFCGRKDLRKKEHKRQQNQGDHTKRMEWVENHEYLKDTFRTIDADRSGHIDIEELHHLLISFGYKITTRETKTLLNNLLGKDHDHISQTAFLAAYESGALMEQLESFPTKGKGAVHDPAGLRGWSDGRKLFGHSFAETLSILMLVHTPVTKQTFLFFNCHEMYGKYFMRSDYSIQCWDSDQFVLFAPYVFSIMLLFVVGLPAVICFYILKHRQRLHSPQVKERIGFLYERFNGGAEAWEVHEVVKKAILTGAIVFITDPVMQATSAVVVCAMACCSLNYFRPHKNKFLFWIGQLSFMTTLLVFLFAIVLISAVGMREESNMFAIGVILIALNLTMIVASIVSVTYQVGMILNHIQKAERASKAKITPFGADGVARSLTLKDYTQRIVNNNIPIAQRHMLEYTRITFGAGSLQYSKVSAIIADLEKDRIHHKRDLNRRMNEIFEKQNTAIKTKAAELTHDLWLV
jgi:predicted outer membrane repeat protein